MKALYIPVSSLNFNNIFASESISPVCFYSKRNFGYKTFEKIEELNHFENSIIAFDKFPIFEVKADGRDNYPMVIEIIAEFDNLPVKILDDVAIFQCAETIYLNPFKTKVYFLSEEAKKITVLGAERSLSTKMVSLYEKSFCFSLLNKESNVSTFQFKSDTIKEVEDVSGNEIGKFIDIDQRKNKAKGFLYSYLLGANRSLSKELIIIKKTTREISNIISAIINSPDKSPTQFQKEDLLKNAEVFNTAFKNIDKDSIETEKLLNRYGNELSVSNIKKILRDTYLINKIENLFDIFNIVSSELNFETAISKIYNNTKRIESEYFANKSKLKLSEKVNLANIKLTRFEEDKPDFYMALINEFISFDLQNESRLDIATAGIKLLIRMYEEKNIPWNPSPQRDFFNGLLANMQGKGVFNVNNSNDIVHQSFALFVLHKEKDELEKLETMLISNMICEYRFAYGLWGAFNGFANMPKTLTNELFLSNDVNYVSEVYKFIYLQVHGIELDGKLKKTEVRKQPIEAKPEVQVIVTKKEVADPTSIKSDNQEIKLKLKACNLKPEQLDSICEIYEKNHFVINEKFFSAIKKIRGIGGKAIEKIRKAIDDSVSQSDKNTKLVSPLLFDNMKPELGKEFYLDSSIWYYIEPIVPKDFQKKVKTEIDWIQRVHKENGYKRKTGDWISLTDHSNNSVIKHFENNAKNRIDSKLLEKIVSKLFEFYK